MTPGPANPDRPPVRRAAVAGAAPTGSTAGGPAVTGSAVTGPVVRGPVVPGPTTTGSGVAIRAVAAVSALVVVLALAATLVDPTAPWVPAALAGSREALPAWWAAVLALLAARACAAAARSARAAPSRVTPSTAAPSTAAPSTGAPSTGAPSIAAPSSVAPRLLADPVPVAWAVLGAALVVVSVQHVVPLAALVSGSPWLGVLPWPVSVHPVEAALLALAGPAAVVLLVAAPGGRRWWWPTAGACLALAWGGFGTGLLHPSWDSSRSSAAQLALELSGVVLLLLAASRARAATPGAGAAPAPALATPASGTASGTPSGTASGPLTATEPSPVAGEGPGGPRGTALLEVVALVDVLRSPGGCAWTASRTHDSLTRYAVEEAHEVVEAVETGDPAALREELGDLLLQVVLHARLAQEHPDAAFDVDDVARGLAAKLRRRHPHVFGPDAHPATVEELEADWHRLKAAEGGRRSVLDGVPASLPALQRAQQVLDRAARVRGGAVGGGPPAGTGAAAASTAAPSPSAELPGPVPLDPAQDLGEHLLGVVEAARRRGEDAEAALRTAVRHLEERVRAAGG